MLKKTITYEDLDGKEITEDFYFHLSSAEIAEIELVERKGLEATLKEAAATSDGATIIRIFKEIIGKAYGVRGEDGKSFIKTPELWTKFMQTDAYSELFIELVTDAEASAAFVRGIMPKKLADRVEAANASAASEQSNVLELPQTDVPLEEDKRPAYQKEGRQPTPIELQRMTPAELQEAFRLRGENPVQ